MKQTLKEQNEIIQKQQARMEDLERAVTILRSEADPIVLGPTEDGGYYWIGMRHPHPDVFQGIAWSTSLVLAQTPERAQALGLAVRLLPSWYDIDRPEDLARLR